MLAPVPLLCHRHPPLNRNWSSRPRRCFPFPESQLLLLCYELSGFSIAAAKSYSCLCSHAHLLCMPGVSFLSTHDHSNACNFTYSFKMKRFLFCFGQKIESNFSPVVRLTVASVGRNIAEEALWGCEGRSWAGTRPPSWSLFLWGRAS